MQIRAKNSFTDRAGHISCTKIDTIQVNLGRLCNLSCTHCHHAASPDSTEVMPWTVMVAIIAAVDQAGIKIVDITGGAKEVVDAETDQTLGVALLSIEGGEVMTVLQVAMLGKLPYSAIRDGVFAHPTLAESLNNLFMSLDS